jgi:energy-coupling factor transporter ATP-binding protein EcfA2
MNAEAVVTVFSLALGGYYLMRAALRRVAGWLPIEAYDDEPAATAPPAPDYGAALADDPDAPLRADEWLYGLNDEADKLPHLAIYGPSGSGKSTLALVILQRRAGRLVICTPKNAQDDPWGGFPAVRLGVTEDDEPDYGPIGDAIEAVYREMNRRNAGTSTDRTPITLVVDELTSVIYELKGRDLQAKLIRLWLMGRSVRIRLVTMDPTANVKGWGLDGRGDVRESIGFIRCERDKSAMLGELEECRAADGVPLDTAEVPALAAQGLDAGRVWVPLFNSAISRPDAVYSGATTRLSDSGSGHSTWDEQVREMAANGLSTRRILAALGGNYNEIVRLAREAREERI